MTWSTLRLHLWLSFTTTGSCRKSSLCSSLFTRILRLMAVSSLLVLALQSSPDPVLPFLFPFVISEHSWEDRQHQIQDCWVWGETERDDARIRWLLWLDTVWWCEDEYSPADPLPGNVQLVSHLLSSQGTPFPSFLSFIDLPFLALVNEWLIQSVDSRRCMSLRDPRSRLRSGGRWQPRRFGTSGAWRVPKFCRCTIQREGLIGLACELKYSRWRQRTGSLLASFYPFFFVSCRPRKESWKRKMFFFFLPWTQQTQIQLLAQQQKESKKKVNARRRWRNRCAMEKEKKKRKKKKK